MADTGDPGDDWATIRDRPDLRHLAASIKENQCATSHAFSPWPSSFSSVQPRPARNRASSNWHKHPPRLPGKNSSGLDAWEILVGNSITGKEDGETLVEYYAADGTAKSMMGNQISTGQWALVGDTVCFKYPDEEMDCYKLEVIGNTVTMTDSTGEATRYEILKGNRMP
jgi:hypothetical protein